MLLKSAEVSTVHESESALLENQVARENDSVNQEMDASRYQLTLFITIAQWPLVESLIKLILD